MQTAVTKRLKTLWKSGVFRGEATELLRLAATAEDAAQADEILIFAALGQLVEEQPLSVEQRTRLAMEKGQHGETEILRQVALGWGAAMLLQPQEAVERLQWAELQVSADRREGVALRGGVTAAWLDLAIAESALKLGDIPTAQVRLQRLTKRKDPLSVIWAAKVRLALVTGLETPAAAVRGLDEVAAAAEARHQRADSVHALFYSGLFSAIRADLHKAQRVLTQVITVEHETVPPRYATMGHILLSALRAPINPSYALENLGQGIRLAAQSGDYFAYVLLILQSARLYSARGSVVDAIATLSHGIYHLQVAGGRLAAEPLILEREKLAQHLGPAAYEQALQRVIAQLDQDIKQIQ